MKKPNLAVHEQMIEDQQIYTKGVKFLKVLARFAEEKQIEEATEALPEIRRIQHMLGIMIDAGEHVLADLMMERLEREEREREAADGEADQPEGS